MTRGFFCFAKRQLNPSKLRIHRFNPTQNLPQPPAGVIILSLNVVSAAVALYSAHRRRDRMPACTRRVRARRRRKRSRLNAPIIASSTFFLRKPQKQGLDESRQDTPPQRKVSSCIESHGNHIVSGSTGDLKLQSAESSSNSNTVTVMPDGYIRAEIVE